MFIPDPKIYEVAREIVMQRPIENIKEILLSCIDFDEDNIDEVMSIIRTHRDDVDGGYSAFLSNINQLLGEEVYCIDCKDEKYNKGQVCSL